MIRPTVNRSAHSGKCCAAPMQQKYTDFEQDTDDMRLYAQFVKYMRTVLWRARRDYLEKETRYKQIFLLDVIPLEEKYDVEDVAATEEIERLLNWEMLKSHLKVSYERTG